MRLRLLLPLLALLLVPGPADAARPSAVAKVEECSTSLAAAKRFMVVEGRMRATPRSDRMQIRFDLRVRTSERGRFKRLEAPGFGEWNTAGRGAGRYVYEKRVESLAAPADYRMTVRFRWLDDEGRRLEEVRRVTRVCEQPDLRPDLSVGRVTVEPGPREGTSRYVVPLRNRGESAAPPFAVVLSIGGEALPAEAVTGLDEGGRERLEIVGPRCTPGQELVVQVDSEEAVEEASEDDNRGARTCPR